MLREHLPIPPERHFRWRGGDVSRLEALTDGIFGFAITLLVIALEVPASFDDLVVAMKGFPAFAISFALLATVWYKHVIFSRRYGLQTPAITALNLVLLFVVLFYVYPLKFLFNIVVAGFTHGATLAGRPMSTVISDEQVPLLMVIYGAGYAAVSFVLAAMYWYALHKRRELELNEAELTLTRQSMMENAVLGGIGLVSAGVALLLPAESAGSAGWVYVGIAPYLYLSGRMHARRAAALARGGATGRA